MTRVGQFVRRTRTGVFGTMLAALTLSACIQEESTGPTPLLPPEPPDNPQILQTSWRMDVFRNTRKVIITPPSRGSKLDKGDLQLLADYFGVAPGSPDLSILAGDAVEINFTPGTFTSVIQPGNATVRTRFDVSIRNKLSAVNIITPTFPAPPTGTTGVILFPFEIVVTETPGGVTTNPEGTTLLVELPNRGLVAPSVDWDVSPFNFFNDTGCGPTSNDCYRSETFNSASGQILGGATSESRNVGFDHDATVSQFRVRMIVAGDLADATPNALPVANAGGPYTGNIGSPTTLAGAGTDSDGTIVAFNWDFDNDGAFDDSNSATGPFTCTATGAVTIRLQVRDNRGATATANATVNCGAPVNNPPVANAGGPYTGVIGGPAITVTGAASTDVGGAITAYAWDLDNDGAFDDATGVTASFTCTAPSGAKTIRLQVTDNGTPALTGVATGTVNCGAAAQSTIRGRWVNAAGAAITTATVGATVFFELDIQLQGGQSITDFQALLNYATAQLVSVPPTGAAGTDLNCSNPGGQATCPSGAPAAGNSDVMTFYNGFVTAPGSIGFSNFTTGSGTGIQGLARFQFTASAAGTVTPGLILDTVASGATNLIPTLAPSVLPALTIN